MRQFSRPGEEHNQDLPYSKSLSKQSLWSYHAFTLVELLVVISIIALLLSILMPSLSKARELSKRTVCALNIKGVTLGVVAYGMDNKYCMPTWYDKSTPENGAALAWTIAADNTIYNYGVSGGFGLLYPSYVNNGRAFFCPSSKINYDTKFQGSPGKTSFRDVEQKYAGLLTVSSSYQLRGDIKPVEKNGAYKYYSPIRVYEKTLMNHPNWIIATDLGTQYYLNSPFGPNINHTDRAGHPTYFSNGWADGHVTPYKVKVKDWTGFPNNCRPDAAGLPVYPLTTNMYWSAAGMIRMAQNNW